MKNNIANLNLDLLITVIVYIYCCCQICAVIGPVQCDGSLKCLVMLLLANMLFLLSPQSLSVAIKVIFMVPCSKPCMN